LHIWIRRVKINGFLDFVHHAILKKKTIFFYYICPTSAQYILTISALGNIYCQCILCICWTKNTKILQNAQYKHKKNTLKYFYFRVTVHRDKFLIIKPARCTNSSILFWNETLHVLDSSSVHHQEFFTVHTAMVYVIPICWQLTTRIRMEHPDHSCRLSANWYDVYHWCVYSEKLLMMDRGTVQKT